MKNNLYQNLKYSKKEEIITRLYQADNVEIIRISSSNQTTDWMMDVRFEIAFLLEGEAIIEFLDRKEEIKKGDMILINPHEKHRVINQSANGLWLAIYFT